MIFVIDIMIYINKFTIQYRFLLKILNNSKQKAFLIKGME